MWDIFSKVIIFLIFFLKLLVLQTFIIPNIMFTLGASKVKLKCENKNPTNIVISIVLAVDQFLYEWAGLN